VGACRMTEADDAGLRKKPRRKSELWHWATLGMVFALIFGVIPYQKQEYERKRDGIRQTMRQQGRIEGFSAMMDAFEDMRERDPNFDGELAHYHTLRFLHGKIRNSLPPHLETFEAFRAHRRTPYAAMPWI